jgi:hypothetical protein
MNMKQYINQADIAYSRALEAVAMGEPYDSTKGAIIDSWPSLDIATINDILNDALEDALICGVENEDIDMSWFN